MLETNDHILKCISLCRVLNLQNLMYFQENGIPQDYEEFSQQTNNSNLSRNLRTLVKRDFLVSCDYPSKVKFSNDQFTIDDTSTNVTHYYLSKKGIAYAKEMGFLKTLPYSFREENILLYSFLNGSLLNHIKSFLYVFDAPKHVKGPIDLHEVHGHLHLPMFKMTSQLGCWYRTMNVAVKFLSKSELNTKYIRFLMRHVFEKNKKYDWILLLSKDAPDLRIEAFQLEHNQLKISQRYAYLHKADRDKIKLVETPTQYVAPKQPYQGGAPFSLLSLQQIRTNLEERLIDDFKI